MLLATLVSEVGLACARGDKDSERRSSPWNTRQYGQYRQYQPTLTHPALWGRSSPGGRGRRPGSCPPPPGGEDGGEAAQVLRGDAAGAGWGAGEVVVHLALALKGTAVQVLLDLTPGEQRDLQYRCQSNGSSVFCRPSNHRAETQRPGPPTLHSRAETLSVRGRDIIVALSNDRRLSVH